MVTRNEERRVEEVDDNRSVRRLKLKPHDALARMRREREAHNAQVGGTPLDEAGETGAETDDDPLSRRC
jgi:hypothetical protein